jgi:glycerol-3-phosphate cytidylyltransferase-like family protein
MRVMLFGTFDDLHPGHEYVLRTALMRASSHENEKSRVTSDGTNDSKLMTHNSGVWAVVARDTNVMRIKGHTPLQTQEQRIEAITRMFPEVHAILGDESNFLAPIRSVQPDLILLGYDQKLPPGVHDDDLGVPVERLEAFEPHIHKSSIRRAQS